MKLTSILWSLFGLCAPLGIALLTIPHLITEIGFEKFGLLSLAWGLIGYAGVFDLGIGRATTQLVARYIGESKFSDAYQVLKVSETISSIVGGVGGGLLCLIVLCGGTEWIKASSSLSRDLLLSGIIIALTIPFQCLSTMYRGYCEAYQRFKTVNIIKTLLGVINFLGPYVISLYSNNLYYMILTLFISRVFAVLIYKYYSEKISIDVKNNFIKISKNDTKIIKEKLLSFGGWYTISSIVSPFLVQMDRFFIAGILSASFVGIYTLPYEIVTKMIVFVSAVSSVALPRYAAFIKTDRKESYKEFKKWLWIVTILMGAGCLILFLLFPFVLTIWVGKMATPESILVGKVLCLGIFLNAVGIMYYTYIHADGDSKSTALVHLVELPFYVILLYAVIKWWGVEGAAIAWTFRTAVDTILMYAIVMRQNNKYKINKNQLI